MTFTVNSFVVVEGYGVGKIIRIGVGDIWPYTVEFYPHGTYVPFNKTEIRQATDSEILAARLQGLCPSLTS